MVGTVYRGYYLSGSGTVVTGGTVYGDPVLYLTHHVRSLNRSTANTVDAVANTFKVFYIYIYIYIDRYIDEGPDAKGGGTVLRDIRAVRYII
jgi:hypothetical protein